MLGDIMKILRFLILLCFSCNSAGGSASPESRDCPRTLGFDKVFSQPWPQSPRWFGSEALAVILPEKGVWPTTVPGHLIAVKLFWWSAGFEPGMERDLAVRITRLDPGKNDAVVSRPTNATADSLGGSTMLTGIDFQSPGCWEVAASYRGQDLAFVVETRDYRDYTEYRKNLD